MLRVWQTTVFITNFITIVFLILCSVPFHVQLVTICDKLCKLYFSKHFIGVFKKIHCVLQTVIRLYWVASQCQQFCVSEQRLKRNRPGLKEQLIQTVPPMDDSIPGLQTRPILVFTEQSPLLAPSTPQTLALQQDSVTEGPISEPVPQPPKPTEDRSSDSEQPRRHLRCIGNPRLSRVCRNTSANVRQYCCQPA